MKSKELKKEALSKVNGKFHKLVLIQLMFTLVTVAFSFLINYLNGKTNSSTIVSFIISILYFVFAFPFTFGVLSSVVNISKGNDDSVTEFINIGLKKFKNFWKVTLRLALKLLLPIVIFFVLFFILTFVIINNSTPNINTLLSNLFISTAICYVLFAILMIILLLPYAVISFVLYDNPEKTSKEILEISRNLMKNNKLKYIGLMLSFIGWFILSGIVLYIASIYLPSNIYTIVGYIPMLFLSPYITITQFAFYENLKENANVPNEPLEENIENTETEE